MLRNRGIVQDTTGGPRSVVAERNPVVPESNAAVAESYTAVAESDAVVAESHTMTEATARVPRFPFTQSESPSDSRDSRGRQPRLGTGCWRPTRRVRRLYSRCSLLGWRRSPR